MNFHSDSWILDRVKEHYDEAVSIKGEDKVVGVFFQGSANYGLDYKGSDVDTKAIIIPSFEDIVFNKSAVSTTHIRENDEHIDFKDIRLMFQNFKKQNINFLEVLFTKYKVMNPYFEKEFQLAIDNREKIAHYNVFYALNAMAGMSMEKYHALEHPYPAWEEHIAKYGYSNKQLHHILRLYDFISRYSNGVNFEDCLIPEENIMPVLMGIKEDPSYYNLKTARQIAKEYNKMTYDIKENYINNHEPFVDKNVEDILNQVALNIIKKEFKREILL